MNNLWKIHSVGGFYQNIVPIFDDIRYREYDFKHCIFFFTSNYVLSGEGVDDKKRPIGFSISDTVENIDFKDGAVEIGYKESTIQEKPEDNLQMPVL